MGDHFLAATRSQGRAKSRILLAFGHRYDLDDASGRVHGGETLCLDGRNEDLVGRRFRHRPRRDDSDLAFDSRIEDKVAPRQLRNGFHYCLDVRALEVEEHLALARLHASGRCAGVAGKGALTLRVSDYKNAQAHYENRD